jgi:hypothetical protein
MSRVGRRIAPAMLGAILATGLAGVPAPTPVRAATASCDTVALTSPAPLTVAVTVAGCGDAMSLPMVQATLFERRSGRAVRVWSSSMTPGPAAVVDGTFDVLAAGWYDLSVYTAVAVPPADSTQTAEVLVADGGLVTLATPYVGFRTGALGSSWPASLFWTRIGSTKASKYQVQRSLDGGAFTYLASTTAASLNVPVAPGHAYQYRVRGINAGGKAGPWRVSDPLGPRAGQENTAGFVFGGTWATSSSSRFWGGHAQTASTAGRSATLTFWGEALALVMSTGPTRGSFRVYVDGVYKRTVSTYASATAHHRIVYSVWWPEYGQHSIKLVVAGTAGHPRIDLDGVLMMDLNVR